MGQVAARIERLLEDSVGDAFARVFGGAIVPAESSPLLRSGLPTVSRTLAGDRFLAPTATSLPLSASDFREGGADPLQTFFQHLAAYISRTGLADLR